MLRVLENLQRHLKPTLQTIGKVMVLLYKWTLKAGKDFNRISI